MDTASSEPSPSRQILDPALKSVMDYIRAEQIHLYHYGKNCYVNLSSDHIPNAVLAQRRALESSGTMKKRNKVELAKSGIYMSKGFHGRYCFWEFDGNIVNEYVESLR